MLKRVGRTLPRAKVVALIACMLLSGVPAWGQSAFGAISGTVLDQAGAAIPGAQVVIKSLETGLTRETRTNDEGYYRVPALPTGRYSVTITAQNFETLVREPIDVTVAQDTSVDAAIKPGGVTELVTVTGEAPLIETTRGQISHTVDARRILELPGRRELNGLALLAPGTLPNNNGRPGSGFSVNGGRSRSNNFTIDGANNNDQSLSIPRQSIPSVAIKEFQLITNNFSAEYGRNSGSYVNVITQSGTNEFHGGGEYTWAGNGLDALTTGQVRTFEAALEEGLTKKEALRRARGVIVDNSAGFFIGGPVLKNHTHFFTSYDRNWNRRTTAPTTLAISPEGLANLQANAGLFAPGALDFLTSTFPIANDPTPRGVINVSVPGRAPIPVPIHQFNRSIAEGGLPFAQDFYRWLLRMDTRISNNDTLNARYLIDHTEHPGVPTAIAGNEVGNRLRNQSLTINEVHLFGPQTVNEFRFTYARRNATFPENLPPSFTIGGFNSVGNANFPQFRVDNMYEFTDNVTLSRGSHSFKTGVNVLRYQLNSFFAPNTRGTVSYSSLTNFLLDRTASFSQYAGEAFVPARTTEFSGFFQDDWRATQNLTLNLGLRYEYTGAPFGYFSNAKPDINNWAPRFGFAWSPRADGGILGRLVGGDRMVIRGGYSIAYDQVFQNILLNNARNFPRGVTVALTNITGGRLFDPANRPAPPTPEDFLARGGNPDLLPVRLYSPNKRISQPYGQQFSLGIERQFLRDYVFKIYYVGSRGVKLVREVESNIGFSAAAIAANPDAYAEILPTLQPVRNAAGVITAFRRDPTKGSILIGDGIAQSAYHSMQLTVRKRFSHGLDIEGNYTYSSFINDSDDILGGQTNNTLPAVPFDFKLDRARSGFDQPHRFVLNYVYAFPSPWESNPVFGRILGGWQIAGVTTYASGTPFTVLNSANALGILAGQISTVEGSQRPSINPNGNPGTATSSTEDNPFYIFNPANSGIVGTAGRNTERTGPTRNWDMSLVKNTRLFGENQRLQLRWEVFNVFNTRNFTSIPANVVSADTNTELFLNLGQTNVSGRNMLFTARFFF
ncbi:MAG TPA: TonB-dependent receptor [Blastocatellia bacterium]|nr:TonB-dependent receptor [Blastocatellia bacterium]